MLVLASHHFLEMWMAGWLAVPNARFERVATVATMAMVAIMFIIETAKAAATPPPRQGGHMFLYFP